MTVSLVNPKKTTARDMTEGPIVKQIIFFALPLMLGNIFQMLYNTVDSIVVGNFVGTQALAAVGSTTMIVNMVVNFFNGFSVGAGVVIGNFFGARKLEKLHRAVETTMAATFVMSILITAMGVAAVKPMLRLMSTPEDVLDEATLYLQVYIGGISGLLIYNMGSGILRAVGDTIRPLFFLVLTSVVNIVLDLVFVLGLHSGIAGVAWATVISQFLSAFLVMALLTRSKEAFRLTWSDLKIDHTILGRIFAVGLPAGIQSIITSFSNVFVQSRVNFFGSHCMAGWSCYNKLDHFVALPMQSMAMAATAFVSQNIGAGKQQRADKGTAAAAGMTLAITGTIVALLYLFAAPAVGLFSPDESVISYGVLFIRANSFFLLFACLNPVLAGALRGRGDSRGPMIIMLLCFVGIRQVYLYIVTRFVANTPLLVSLSYPVGWISCCIIEAAYFFCRSSSDLRQHAAELRKNEGI